MLTTSHIFGILIVGYQKITSKGTFENYDSAYKKALSKASTITIPNVAFPGLDFFANNISVYSRTPWYKKWNMDSPYKKLNSALAIEGVAIGAAMWSAEMTLILP